MRPMRWHLSWIRREKNVLATERKRNVSFNRYSRHLNASAYDSELHTRTRPRDTAALTDLRFKKALHISRLLCFPFCLDFSMVPCGGKFIYRYRSDIPISLWSKFGWPNKSINFCFGLFIYTRKNVIDIFKGESEEKSPPLSEQRYKSIRLQQLFS